MAWVYLSPLALGHRLQSRCPRRLPGLNVPYFVWHWISSLDTCQPQTWSHQDSQVLGILDRGCSTWILTSFCGMISKTWSILCVRVKINKRSFEPFCVWILWHEETLCTLYTSYFSIHIVPAMAICSMNGCSCLNCWIPKECLKVGRFDVHYQCISAWWHCDCSTRARVWCWAIQETCSDAVCWHLSLFISI